MNAQFIFKKLKKLIVKRSVFIIHIIQISELTLNISQHGSNCNLVNKIFQSLIIVYNKH